MTPSRGAFWGLSAAWLLLASSTGRAEEAVPLTVRVPANVAWTRTGLEVAAGQSVLVEATGTARVVRRDLREWLAGVSGDRSVGPPGTYVWPRGYPVKRRATSHGFALPTMIDGPFPAFGLIGRIGSDGPPWFIGSRREVIADRSGMLWLGLNDDNVSDNRGHFDVTVHLQRPRAPEAAVPPPAPLHGMAGVPIPNARVLLLYVDGLRPDVLQVMADAGYLPNFKRAFLDRGLMVPQAFSVFPSNTLIANGSLWTGLFSDRTGIKSQNQFERSTLEPAGQLSRWLPDGFIPAPEPHVFNLLDKYAPENTHTFLMTHGVPTLASRLSKAFAFTTLPIAPLNPPPLWFHHAVNILGPFGLANRLAMRLDAVNTAYAVEEMIGHPDVRVMAVWMPMVDKTCHHSRRGQFGAARRDLAMADRYLGRLLDRLDEVRWTDSTYLILVSDHGHLGGEAEVNRSCNLPRDWAHRQLGVNAKVVGREWWHPGMSPQQFLFFDNQGAGQAKIFLPYGSYVDGPWRRNRLFELTHYRLRPSQPSVNLLTSLKQFRPQGWAGGAPPVDLMFVKLDAQRVVVMRDEECQAIIHHARAHGHDVYQYEPVRHMVQDADGALTYDPPAGACDPFGYFEEAAQGTLKHSHDWWLEPHTDREWLQATSRARYPDAIVTVAKFFAWRGQLARYAELRDPDLLMTASEGWSFRSDDGEGTDHGYPLAGSMRITLILAGANIAHGVREQPQRLVDVAPTILEMIGWRYDASQLDGQAMRGIYEKEFEGGQVTEWPK